MSGVSFYFNWEVELMQWLQSIMSDGATAMAGIVTYFGEKLVLVVILVFLYFCFDKEMGKFFGECIAPALVFNPMIKNVVLRRRPYFDNEGIKCLQKVNPSADELNIVAQGYSFPSAHSTNSMIVYGSIPVYIRRLLKKEKSKPDIEFTKDSGKLIKLYRLAIVIAILFPLMVGISRVALGNHYPTDVMVGWMLGIIILAAMNILQDKVKSKDKMHIIIFAVSALGCIYCRSNDYFTGLGVMAGFYLADWFERKYVNFKNTRNVGKCFLRLLGAGALYGILELIMKVPFSEEFRHSATAGSFALRFVRYTVICFVVLGVYPLVFDKIKLGKTNEAEIKE